MEISVIEKKYEATRYNSLTILKKKNVSGHIQVI